MNRLPYLLITSGFLIIAVALSLYLYLTESHKGNSFQSDEDNSSLWDFYKDTPRQTIVKIHLFNVENPEDVLLGSRPTLREIGPFSYQATKTRDTLKNVDGLDDRITYTDSTLYKFLPDLTKGSLEDNVTIINLPWVGLAQEISKLSVISRLVVTGIVSRYQESIFMTRSIKQLIFEGYYQELIATFSSITGETYMPNNTFGFFYGRNGTATPPREINLGVKTPSEFGATVKFNNESEMTYWKETCNKFEGSDWDLFPPGIDKTSKITVFSHDMCRNVDFEYEKEVKFNGVDGYRFVMNLKQNECYCEDHGECAQNGVYSISKCSKGASILLSKPHFYEGADLYLFNASGLHPSKELHDSFIDIEPKTGRVLRYSKRIQVNLHLKPLRFVSEFRKVPNMIFPVMWTDETSTISEEGLAALNGKLKTSSTLIAIGSSIIFTFGIILIFFGFGIFCARLRKKNYAT